VSGFLFFTDSTTDLPEGMADELGVRIIPLSYNIDGNTYIDQWDGLSEEGNVSPGGKGFYDLMREGAVPETSHISRERFADIFEPLLREGHDIVYLTVSGNLSTSFERANQVTRNLAEKYPERRITAIDSKSACMGEGLLVYLAAKKRDEGVSYDEFVGYILRMRQKINHWLTLDELKYLKRSGRLSAPAAFMSGLMNLNPILWMDGEGRLSAVDKVRGRKKAFETIVNTVAERIDDPVRDPIFIAHSDCAEKAEALKSLIENRMKTKNIIIGYIGPVIGSHIGPGMVAVFFVGKERE
jgi:DegV family protein with EDD domain